MESLENLYLFFNYENGRCGVIDENDDWFDDGLHCGACFQVLIDGVWHHTRIELGFDDYWYLVNVPGPYYHDFFGLQMKFYK